MAVRPLTGVLHCLRRAVLTAEGQGPPDGELLEAYRTRREQPAFEALVRRHAPMVWGVCRRVLGDVHDAEDAFQATFLVLVRKAASIRPAHLVGNWLHGVAHRTAMNAKASRARRMTREMQPYPMNQATAEKDRALALVLDEELDHLPAKYRATLLLCDLEGKTRKEAARQLGCPEGTVAGRLARARVLLAKRLTRRGLALSGGALALELARTTASAGVPGRVIAAALKASAVFAAGTAAGTAAGGIQVNVLALTKGVLKAMLLDKLRLTFLYVAILLGGLAAATTGLLPARNAAAAQPDEPAAPTQEPPSTQPARSRRDRDPAIQGLWTLERVLRDGKTLTIQPGGTTLVVTNRYLILKGDDDVAFTYKVNTGKNPKHIDLTPLDPGRGKGAKVLGVYAMLADTLVIHESDGTRPRDANFQGTMGTTVSIYRRTGNVAALASVPDVASALPEATPPWANKLFEAKGPTSHDFGKLARGTHPVHRFRMKNIYSVPLDITGTRMSCGCGTVTTPVKRLQPNEEGYIDVLLNTRRFAGPKTITVYVGVGGKDCASTAVLRVTADSQEDDSPVRDKDSQPMGKVIRVDEKSKLVEVNIGSDEGLKQDQVLSLFRLQPRAEYLGRVRIIHVQSDRSIGRIVTRPARKMIQVGDDVGRIP